MGGLARRIGLRQRDDALGNRRWQRRNAQGARLVAQQPLDTFVHEPLLPAPHAGLALPVRRMISLVPPPSAVNSTIRTRHTCF